ncbi:hypothetical protein O9992_13220 [Vibrio lentus]|nr:hypothetical protein [Vibrio lentus]
MPATGHYGGFQLKLVNTKACHHQEFPGGSSSNSGAKQRVFGSATNYA